MLLPIITVVSVSWIGSKIYKSHLVLRANTARAFALDSPFLTIVRNPLRNFVGFQQKKCVIWQINASLREKNAPGAKEPPTFSALNIGLVGLWYILQSAVLLRDSHKRIRCTTFKLQLRGNEDHCSEFQLNALIYTWYLIFTSTMAERSPL